jgi:hypothetical protein
MGRSQVRVQVISLTLKMVLTAPQPVLVIMSLSKGNALAIKRRSSFLIQWTSRQRWYNSKGWLSDKIKKGIRLTDLYKCLAFDMPLMMSAHLYLILFMYTYILIYVCRCRREGRRRREDWTRN